jgi:hypothetical protein
LLQAFQQQLGAAGGAEAADDPTDPKNYLKIQVSALPFF